MKNVVAAVLVTSVCLVGVPARSDDSVAAVNNRAGRLGYLSNEIGTYHFGRVIDDAVVAAELVRRVGASNMRLVRQRLDVQGPIAFDGTYIVMQGIMAHGGTTDEAIVGVRPRDGDVQAALLVGGRQVLLSGGQYALQAPQTQVERQAFEWSRRAGVPVTLIRAGGR